MARFDEQIREQNPWWQGPDRLADDPHLRELGRAGFDWTPPVAEAIPLEPGAVHTLRGPRQVGKTTTLKRFVQRLVASGERRVLHFSFDLERDNRASRGVVVRAKRIHPDPEGPWYIFLDEVTSIPDWQLGIKYLWDVGEIREDLVLCTGSSARKMGTERLPGRRGNGRDLVQLPMSFRAFCETVVGLDLPDESVQVADWLTPAGRRFARELYLHADALEDAIER